MQLGQDQTQLLDGAYSADAAVADEAGRLVVPFGKQKIDRVLERAGNSVIVLGRDENVTVEVVDLSGPRFLCAAYYIVPWTAAPARREAAG